MPPAGDLSDTWKVAPEADRVGYRFKGGKPLEFVPREPPFGAAPILQLTDACYPYGSIQVPGALSRSCCIVTRFLAEATSWSARSYRPIWI